MIHSASPSQSYASLLAQAKTAVRQGRSQEARRLVQQAVRQDPQDFRGWLWLATVAQSPQASLEYISRAEMLAPQNTTVQKARRWAEKRVESMAVATPSTLLSDTVAQPQATGWPKQIRRLALGVTAIMLITAAVVFAWQYFQPVTETSETAVFSSNVAGVIQAEADSNIVAVAAVESATATSTPEPHAPAKLIASTGADQPRPTWTVTPTPSPTPTPTPTVIPTFVNPNYQDAVRPFGVGPNERWIDVNLTTQTLTAFEGDTAVFSTLISSGTWDHPTVTGQFRIWLEYESQTMDGRLLGYDYYLENVPYVMYFFQDYALHGTYWHNNFGTPMSHGCVNMRTDDAAWLYSFASIGTMVNVHY